MIIYAPITNAIKYDPARAGNLQPPVFPKSERAAHNSASSIDPFWKPVFNFFDQSWIVEKVQ